MDPCNILYILWIYFEGLYILNLEKDFQIWLLFYLIFIFETRSYEL